MDSNEVPPEDKMWAQQEESLAKQNGKLDSMIDIPISKLGNKEALIDTLSDYIKPILFLNNPSILTISSTNYFPTME